MCLLQEVNARQRKDDPVLNWIIDFSLRHRLLVILGAAAFAVFGAVSMWQLDIDAFPDTTPVQVEINSVAPSLGPEEVEQQITFPIEQVLSGLPRLQLIRSISKFGLSQVVVYFEDGTDIYFARQVVNERLGTVQIPPGIEHPKLGPVSTGLGEVFHYVVTGQGDDVTQLRTIHDWVIKPKLRTHQGHCRSQLLGRLRKAISGADRPGPAHQARPDLRRSRRGRRAEQPQRRRRQHSPEQPNAAGPWHRPNCQRRADREHRGDGQGGRARFGCRTWPTWRSDTRFDEGPSPPTARAKWSSVWVSCSRGENSHEVTWNLKRRLEDDQAPLPGNVKVETVYDRTELVDQVIETVRNNLFEGGLLVIVILFAFLGNLRAAGIVALAIPLSMLFAFSGMLRFGIAASLLSLGAIDFGLVVDSSVVMVENCVRHIAHGDLNRKTKLEMVRDAAVEVRKPTMFGELIIMIVYLPILTLEGVEGKMFHPMALTVIFALLGSMVLSVTLMPVLASLLLPKKIDEREPLLMRLAHRINVPILRLCMNHKLVVMGFALCVLVVAFGMIAPNLGSEFVPRLSEEAVVINVVRLAGTDIDESIRTNTLMEKAILRALPDEVEHVWSRVGAAEIATDPMGVELTDIFLMLKPRQRWKKAIPKRNLPN